MSPACPLLCLHPSSTLPPPRATYTWGRGVTFLPSSSSEEPPPRGPVATAASDSQSTWLGTRGWPGRWHCSCGPRPSASLVSPQGMPCPHPSVPSPAVALAGWCPLSPAGAQTTQLLVEPPWMPAVLWDRVTLTCQGSGTAGDTTWYRNGQRGWREVHNNFTVTKIGNYTCDRPGSGRSPPVRVLNDWLVLQVPTWPLLEGDTVTLRCRVRQNMPVTRVQFYHEGEEVRTPLNGTELSLSPLQHKHSGSYRCRGRVYYRGSQNWHISALVTVTVHEIPVLWVSVWAHLPGGQVAPGNRLVLSCAVATGTGPLSFTWHRGDSGALLGTSPHLELRHVGNNDSGHYHCWVSDGDSVAKSVPLNVTILVPVANATITPGPLSHQVHTGDPVTLHCSVQVGSAPVTFTWLHNGQEVAQGPVLELGDIDVGHSGTYQCVATNQLGQDRHRVFRALSPELALEVTPGSPWVTVAVNVGRTLLFLVLLLAVIGGCHCWHRRGG
ncbi:Fc receptor-like protein 4 isoform X2 [Sylvia atricapilla]|uniref:Fc receptor-like protein 4 isoform X2 n=1 Tax=Sylvia atricapilla TaxID=48155 RepID=UPI003390DBD0